MSGFYVPGFTPSDEGYICYIYPDGTVIKPKSDGIKDKDKGMFDVYKGIPVPEHGDLIDRDKLEKDIDKYIGGEESRSRFHHWVQVQSVVIPREKGAET